MHSIDEIQRWSRALFFDGVPVDDLDALRLYGATTIVDGLDYHYRKLLELRSSLRERAKELVDFHQSLVSDRPEDVLPYPQLDQQRIGTALAAEHEQIAYINRLGQFFAFARSLGVDAQMPRAAKLMIFRNKYTAHRAADVPHKDDTDVLNIQNMNALVNCGFGSLNGEPYLEIRTQTEFTIFRVLQDHKVLVDECANVLFANPYRRNQ